MVDSTGGVITSLQDITAASLGCCDGAGLIPNVVVLDAGGAAAQNEAEGGGPGPDGLDSEGPVPSLQLTLVPLAATLLVNTISEKEHKYKHLLIKFCIANCFFKIIITTTKCPKFHSISVLHLLKFRFAAYLNRCSTDAR